MAMEIRLQTSGMRSPMGCVYLFYEGFAECPAIPECKGIWLALSSDPLPPPTL